MQYQNKPLAGVRIIDLTTYGAGPSSAKIMGDWGADVIKVESLQGDPSRHTNVGLGFPVSNGTNIGWEQMNGNKRAISIDIRTKEGLDIMYKLMEGADVFLSNNRMKALVKNGLDWETCSAKFPQLIWAHVGGFGIEGPMSDLPGFDTLCFWAHSGAMADFAERDTSPLTTPIGVADLGAGAMLAGGIGTALYNRTRTGKGEKVTISLYGEAVWMLGSMLTGTQSGKVELPKSRRDNSPLANTYRCNDGEWIILSAFEWDRFFSLLCKVINMPELVSDPRYSTLDNAITNRAYLMDILENFFAGMDSVEARAILTAADFPHAKLNHIKDVVTDEQAWANNFLFKCETLYHGEWALPAGPVQFGGSYPPEHKNAPLLGQHTDEIMGEAGFTAEEIAKFKAEKVIG